MPKRVRQKRSRRDTAYSSMSYKHPIFMLQDTCSPGVVASNLSTLLPNQVYQALLSQPEGFNYFLQSFSFPVKTARCTVIPYYADPRNFATPVSYRRNGFPAYGLMYQMRLPIYQHLGNMETHLRRFTMMKPLYFWYKFTRDSSLLLSKSPYTIIVSSKQNCHRHCTYESVMAAPHRTYKLYSGRSITIRVPILVNKPSMELVNSLTMDQHVGAAITTGEPNPSTAYPLPGINRRTYPLAGSLCKHPWVPTQIFTKWFNDQGFGNNPPSYTDTSLNLRTAFFKYMLRQLSYTGPLIFVTSQVDAVPDQFLNPSSSAIQAVSPFPPAVEGLAPQNGKDIEVNIGIRARFSIPIVKPLSVNENEVSIVMPTNRIVPGEPPTSYSVFGPSAIFCSSGVQQDPFPYQAYRDEASAFVNNTADAQPVPNMQILPTLLPTNATVFTTTIARDRGPFSLTALPPAPTNPNPNSVLWNQDGAGNPVQSVSYDRQDNAEVYTEDPIAFDAPDNYRDL